MPTKKKAKEEIGDSQTVHPEEEAEAAEILTAAHPTPEDPEEHIGDEMLDPWADDKQTDWPNAHSADDTYLDQNQGGNS